MPRLSVRADAERAVIFFAQLRGAHFALCAAAIFFRAVATGNISVLVFFAAAELPLVASSRDAGNLLLCIGDRLFV